ncbi:GDSL esterase/lipase At1g33811-like [Cannabis sativa]|uniref:GDSL esterase/lipase At1g33811-like n=1 Tax=Cannabis sativa TaxID=3483 RepID=UPI0029CA9141|nr:GDSL esterase/lipase At1g33811-like [Cannabis sativa]
MYQRKQLKRTTNYFMTDYYSTSSQYTPRVYASALIQDYTRQLTQLYRLGARKMIVTSVGQIGCIAYELARFNGNNSRCNDDINKAIQIFNTEIIRLVNRFYSQFPGAKFVYMDFYQNTVDLYRKARSYVLYDYKNKQSNASDQRQY